MFWILLVLLLLSCLFVPPLRRWTIARPALFITRKAGLVPQISGTEQTAIESGQTGIEQEFFRAKLRPEVLSVMTEPVLSDEEKQFLEGPVEALCAMCNDWEIWSNSELPPEVWQHLREHKFFGIIIPKAYGGLEFSRLAHSEIIMKLTSRSIPVGITAMVPNSLGPAELLIKYGTEEQKSYYLPRLASGEDIPCFALTEPGAGSDAGALLSEGIVFQDSDGIKIRISWQKRWITLGSVATLMGVAFKLRDPEFLLSLGREEIGITCALIPADTDGITRAWRHDPLGVPFVNSRTVGEDVVVPLDAIIGGMEYAGKGWLMLMESLSAGRGISLPAQSVGGVKSALAVVTAHASIRYQFGLPISKFEGVREKIASIAGMTFMMDATRRMTISAMDKDGILPVVSAIAKYNLTELNRLAINDAMDVMGGSGISEGPHNHLAHAYKAIPIGITVEGANILTRSLIIFGQGAIRSHPVAFPLMRAIRDNDVAGFDEQLSAWTKHFVIGGGWSFLNSLTRGRISRPHVSGRARTPYKRLMWASSVFAFLTDVAIMTQGGALKKKEHLTGRFADVLSWLFINWSVISHYARHQRRKDLDEVFHWSLEYGFCRIQQGFEGIFRNLGGPLTAWFWRGIALGLQRLNPVSLGPTDTVTEKLCDALEDEALRSYLTAGIYHPVESDPLAKLEIAFQQVSGNREVYEKVTRAERRGDLPASDDFLHLFKIAATKGILTTEQYAKVKEAEKSRLEAIKVDAFWDPAISRTQQSDGALLH